MTLTAQRFRTRAHGLFTPQKSPPGRIDVEVNFFFSRGVPDTLQYDYMGVTKTVAISPK